MEKYNYLTQTLVDAHEADENYTSSAISLSQFSAVSVQHIWTGNDSGTVTMIIQGSNDGTNYANIDSYNLSGASGSTMILLSNPAFVNLRISVTQSSGVATVTSIVNAKV